MIIQAEVDKYLDQIHKINDSFESVKNAAIRDKVPFISFRVGVFLKFLVQMKKPSRVCELGSGYGYSTLHIASALNEGTIYTCDASINSYRFVKNEVEKRGLENKIRVFNQTAIDFLEQMKEKNERFDFFFIDAVKCEYSDYLNLVLELSERGALIIFDNLLWKGEVSIKSKTSKKIEFLRGFNDHFIKNKKIYSTIIPLGDGLGLCVVK